MPSTLPALSATVQHLALQVSKDPGSLVHARAAAGILFHPDARGKRAGAVALGVAERTVERMLPWSTGEVLGWVVCDQQGTAGPEVDEAKKTRWSLVLPDRTEVPQGEVLPLEVVVLDQEVAPPGLGETSRARTRTGAPPSGWDVDVLDPSLDCWADPQGRKDDLRCCGTEGWALTLLVLAGLLGAPECEGRIVRVTAAEVREVTGLSERRARDLMQRMQGALVATRERGALAFMPEALVMAMLAPNDRAMRMQERHQREERAYKDPAAVRAKYERRDFLAVLAEHNPDLSPAELAGLHDRIQAERAASQEWLAESMADVLDELEGTRPASSTEPPVVDQMPFPGYGREAALVDFLARIRVAA